jgi:hypothetical protein
MTALQAAEERLHEYVQARLDATPWYEVPRIDPLKWQRLVNEIVQAARCSTDPF